MFDYISCGGLYFIMSITINMVLCRVAWHTLIVICILFLVLQNPYYVVELSNW